MSAPSPSVTAMSKSPRAAHRCTECGWETSKWVGRCGECQAWGSVVEAATPVLRATATAVTTPGGADRPGRRQRLHVPLQRGARARPGAGRRPGARRGHPARRRARRRQEHPAARGRLADGPRPPAHALHHRRGVRVPGPAARRPHRWGARRAVPRRRDRPRRGADPHRGGPAVAAGGRLDPDDLGARPRRHPGRRQPRQGGRGRADPGGQDPQHHHRASSATSPRTARSPARGCSSTSSTWCCTSRATATPASAWSGR